MKEPMQWVIQIKKQNKNDSKSTMTFAIKKVGKWMYL